MSIALWGRAPGRPILRSGARPGDLLFLSGFPGRAAAGLCLARRLAAGGNAVEAAEIANHASGIVVGKIGTATCSPEELRASFARNR